MRRYGNATDVLYKYRVVPDKPLWETVDLPRKQDFEERAEPGWMRVMAMTYIFYYCGEDCVARYAAGSTNLADLERQAEENIRHSIAVVGILDELDEFYKMLHARVSYLDTTLNVDMGGADRHATQTNGEAARCKEKYKERNFQRSLLARSPELRAAHRLYKVAKEVKDFQMQELQKCSPSSFSRA